MAVAVSGVSGGSSASYAGSARRSATTAFTPAMSGPARDDGADLGGRRLRGGVAMVEGARAPGGVDVGARRDAAGEGAGACLEQHGLGGGEDAQVGRERGDFRRVGEVARGVLQAADAAAEAFDQAADDRRRVGDARQGREIIEVEVDRRIRCRRGDAVEIGDDAVRLDAFVVEGRQKERAGIAELRGMARERHRIGHGGRSGAHHQTRQRQRLGGGAHDCHALPARERRRLPRRAADVQRIAAGIEQVSRKRDEAREVRLAVGSDRRGDGGDHAFQLELLHLCTSGAD